MLKVTFLGTGTSQGIPIIGCKCDVCLSSDKKDKRLRSSVLIDYKGKRILIDAGPDFRYQMLREGVDSLDAILLTHEHQDHTGGLDDVRALNYFMGRHIDLYAEKRVLEVIKVHYDYAFQDIPYPGVPKIKLHEIDSNPFKIQDVEIEPIRGLHLNKSVLGYKIGGLAYLTDMNYISPSELNKISNIDVLVINALRIEPHISHFSLSEALKVVEIVNPKRCYLTHMSHQLGKYAETSKKLPKGVSLAYDGLKIEI